MQPVLYDHVVYHLVAAEKERVRERYREEQER